MNVLGSQFILLQEKKETIENLLDYLKMVKVVLDIKLNEYMRMSKDS